MIKTSVLISNQKINTGKKYKILKTFNCLYEFNVQYLTTMNDCCFIDFHLNLNTILKQRMCSSILFGYRFFFLLSNLSFDLWRLWISKCINVSCESNVSQSKTKGYLIIYVISNMHIIFWVKWFSEMFRKTYSGDEFLFCSTLVVREIIQSK